MTAPTPTNLIWATRGRSWGFRFLLNAGFSDPLPEYERAFAELGEVPSGFGASGGVTALRFPDPDGRCDEVGRVIPHEFVVFGELGGRLHSLDAGLREVWPTVSGAYQRIWLLSHAPAASDLRF